jgi:O-antigen/teichoic acid export membrane protein
MAFNFLLIAAYVLPQSLIIRDMNFRTKARIDVLAMVLMAGTGLALAALGWGVWALVAGTIVSNAAKAVGFNIARPLPLMPAFSWGAVERLAQFSALVLVDRLLFFLYGQVDVVIGGRVLGKEVLGLYAVALSLAVIPMEKVLPVITQVAFAAFSRIQAEPSRIRRNFLRGVQLVSLACFPAFFGMAAVAGDLVPVVLGPQWITLILPFQLLCLALPLKALAALFSPALFGVGRPAVDVINMVIAVIGMAAGILVGVQYGLVGMCLAWVFAYPVVFAAISWRSLRTLGVPYGEFLDRCAFPAIASLVMAAGVLALREMLSPLGVSALRLAALVSTGALIYSAFVVLFQRSQVRDLIAVARR